jgi:hypothetical protein
MYTFSFSGRGSIGGEEREEEEGGAVVYTITWGKMTTISFFSGIHTLFLE